MKILIMHLILLLTMQDKDQPRKAEVRASAKAVIESYSTKSSKDALVPMPILPPDALMDRLHMPVLTPLPIFPTNPPPVTEVNP